MAHITPTSYSRNFDTSINLKTLVDPHNSHSPAFGSARRKEPVCSISVKNVDLGLDDDADEPFSVLQFLRDLLVKELGNDRGRDHKLIVFAIHAVLLESGFVRFDPIGNRVINGFQFQDVWPPLFKMSLFYTRPEVEVVRQAQDNIVRSMSIVLKFQSLGKHINVYGSLDGDEFGMVYVIRLDEEQLVPPLNVVWANCVANENTSAGKEVLKFWRDVKDNLAFPLLIDMYEKVGFDLPPCFMKLPSELKLKIMEKVRGVDVANVSCVCSELKHLGESDDLWKLKVAREFQLCADEFQGSWKKTYMKKWEKKNEIKKLACADVAFSMADRARARELYRKKIGLVRLKKRKRMR